MLLLTLPLTQVPRMEKQPVRIFIPEPNVEVAVSERLKKFEPVPEEKSVPGVVVPSRPINPVFITEKSVVVELLVEDPIAKSVWLVSPLFAWTLKFA